MFHSMIAVHTRPQYDPITRSYLLYGNGCKLEPNCFECSLPNCRMDSEHKRLTDEQKAAKLRRVEKWRKAHQEQAKARQKEYLKTYRARQKLITVS